MKKKLICIISLAMLLVSCEEYYNPKLDVVPALLVVESHVTNDPNQNFVKLTKSLYFYSNKEAEGAEGASVKLIESNGTSFTGIESGTGYFTFSRTPDFGKEYMLQIKYQNNIYESDQVVMPPLPTIDTLYTNHKVEKKFFTDAYGVPTQVETPGREICIDAPITPALEYYRFNWTAILQWEYTPSMPPGAIMPPATISGSKTFSQDGLFNLAGPKQFSTSDKIKNHPILFRAYDTTIYLDSAAQSASGWIIIIDQYGISKDSYDFHEKLNQQFSAEGSLFDPVLTQVSGNIHCTTDPTQEVVGFFDLNSYHQYRYHFNSFGSAIDSNYSPPYEQLF